MYISRRVVTVALGRVSRIVARHEGHVRGFGLLLEALVAWKANHSLRHDPQNVCRQSRRVRGW